MGRGIKRDDSVHVPAMPVEYDGLTFERLGHASVRIETENDTVIYIDPWNDVLDSEPGDGDVVFVTHDDFDHYDPAAINAVATPTATIAAYEAIDTGELEFEVVSPRSTVKRPSPASRRGPSPLTTTLTAITSTPTAVRSTPREK